MTTLTIQLSDEMARLAAEKARLADMTVSEWITSRIAGRRRARSSAKKDPLGYPLGWFERTCGSLADVDDFRESEDSSEPPISPLDL